MLLDEGAAKYYDSLPASHTLDQVIAACKMRCSLATVPRLVLVAALWQRSQKNGENVMDYMDWVKHTGQELHLGNKEIKSIILKGINPAICSFVLQGNYDTIDEITETAGKAVQGMPVEIPQDMLTMMVHGEDTLTSGVSQMNLDERNPDQRVGFQEPQNTWNTNRRMEQRREYSSYQAGASSSRPINRSSGLVYTIQSDQGYGNRSARKMSKGGFRLPNEIIQGSGYREPSPRRNATQWSPPDGRSYNIAVINTCGRCGRKYGHFHSCPTEDQSCNFCGELGHFASVCRSVKHMLSGRESDRAGVFPLESMTSLETMPQTLDQDQVFGGTTKLLTNYIICLVGGLSTKCLWDMGSSVSVIRKGKSDALRQNTDIVIEKADIQNVLGVACKRVPVHGMVELEVQIGDYIAHQRFCVGLSATSSNSGIRFHENQSCCY